MAGRFIERSLNQIIHCRMPWKAASTLSAGQTMQTPTVHPLAATARRRNTNISAHSKGNATLKLSESRSVPSDETGKALSQAPRYLSVPWPAIWLYTPDLPHATCIPNSSQQYEGPRLSVD